MTGFAVVTGASSGIGYELARTLADNEFELLICAEDEEIETAARYLKSREVDVHAIRADLATQQGTQQLIDAIEAQGKPVDILVLNAGFGNWGPFVESSLEQDLRLIGLNIVSPVQTAKALLPAMVSRGEGRVLITSSIASQMPGPYFATYAASKSFLQSFSEAIRYELKDTGVTVTSVMPGPTETKFFEEAGMSETKVGQSEKKDDPAEVAQEAFEAMMAGKDHVITGSFKNKAQVASAVVLPDTAKAAVHASQTKPQ